MYQLLHLYNTYEQNIKIKVSNCVCISIELSKVTSSARMKH